MSDVVIAILVARGHRLWAFEQNLGCPLRGRLRAEDTPAPVDKTTPKKRCRAYLLERMRKRLSAGTGFIELLAIPAEKPSAVTKLLNPLLMRLIGSLESPAGNQP